MYVILIGDPVNGFIVAGPLHDTDDAGAAGEWARAKYGVGGADWWEVELCPVENENGDEPTVVVCDCNVEGGFTFYGFKTHKAARLWATPLHGVVMELLSIDREDIASAA